MAAVVSTPIDPVKERQFISVCEGMGLSPAGVLSIFIDGVIKLNSIPFVADAAPKEKMTRAEMLGCMRGAFTMADDFDAPLADFAPYMP